MQYQRNHIIHGIIYYKHILEQKLGPSFSEDESVITLPMQQMHISLHLLSLAVVCLKHEMTK